MRAIENSSRLAPIESWLSGLERETVLDLIPLRAFERGRHYVRALSSAPTTQDGYTVEASIQGTAREPYAVTVARRLDGRLSSRCTCPAFDALPPCKHVGGLLIALAESRALRDAVQRREPGTVRKDQGGGAEPTVSRFAAHRGRAVALARLYGIDLTPGEPITGERAPLLEPTFRSWRRRGELRPLGAITVSLRVVAIPGDGAGAQSELRIRVKPRDERRLFGPDDLESRRLPARERRLFEPLARSRGGTKEFAATGHRAAAFLERAVEAGGVALQADDNHRPLRVITTPLRPRLELRDATDAEVRTHPYVAAHEDQIAAEAWSVRRAWAHFRNERGPISEAEFRELIGLPRVAAPPPPLRIDNAKVLEPVWMPADGESAGIEKLSLADASVFAGTSTWVFDADRAILARVAEDVGSVALARFVAQPQVLVAPEEVGRLPALLREHFAGEGIALPSRPELGLEPLPRATIVLRLTGSPFTVKATLEARYAHATSVLGPATLAHPDDPWRDFEQESAALDALAATHLKPVAPSRPRASTGEEPGVDQTPFYTAENDLAVAFWTTDLPQLMRQADGAGAIDEVLTPRGLSRLVTRSSLTASLSARAGRPGMLDIALAYSSEGVPAEVEEIRRALAAKRGWVRLSDGSVAALSAEVARLAELTHELVRDGEAAELPRHLLGEVDAWGELADELTLDPAVRSWRERLRALSVESEPDPVEGVALELRGYQRAGLAWLQFLADLGVGGILADDMGLGKTAQALALLAWRAERDGRAPTLIVTPTSVAPNWLHEARRFTPGLEALLLHGAGRHATYDRVGEYDLVVTTYALLRRDVERLRSTRFRYVILDEAQHVKNHAAATTAAAKSLDAEARLALTGTPIENRLLELWSILDFCNPGMLGSWRAFSRRYERPVAHALADDLEAARASDPLHLRPGRSVTAAGLDARSAFDEAATLRARIRPFVLRRTKSEVERDLPPKIETNLVVEMTPAQRRAYAALAAATRADLGRRIAKEGFERNRLLVLTALLRLRQMACDPRLVDSRYGARDSAKLGALHELIGEVIAGGRRALVFSQFVELLTLVRSDLDARGIEYAYLDGRTRDRSAVLRSFTEGTMPLFLLSLRAGGTGINLAAADVVIHLDPWWNPAVEDQATDRAHRIGQVRTVSVYRIVAAGTIEEGILRMKQEKRALARAVVENDPSGLKRLTEEDVAELLDFGA